MEEMLAGCECPLLFRHCHGECCRKAKGELIILVQKQAWSQKSQSTCCEDTPQ